MCQEHIVSMHFEVNTISLWSGTTWGEMGRETGGSTDVVDNGC